jgi:DNA-binding transcriptional MerR regulator
MEECVTEHPNPEIYTQLEPNQAEEHLTTGDLAREIGATVRTVRFYEEIGLLTPVGRTEGKHRVYSRSELEKLRFIADLRAVDCSLAEIRALLAIRDQEKPNYKVASEAREMLKERLEAIREKLEQIRRIRDELSATLEFLSECVDCRRESDRHGCRECDAMTRDELPNVVKWIW